MEPAFDPHIRLTYPRLALVLALSLLATPHGVPTKHAVHHVGGVDGSTRVEPALALPDGPIPVDFCVFLGKDVKAIEGNQSGVAPWVSPNIGGADAVTGFLTLCKTKCPTARVLYGLGTAVVIRFCPCVAELLVEDLTTDFGALVTTKEPLFALGTYSEVDLGQEYFISVDGHFTLQQLMDVGPSHPCYRRTGHLMVWVSHHIHGDSVGSQLLGTTFLDQPLYGNGSPGAGVLLAGQSSRSGRRLSHEVGHVVGFEHVAGQPVSYTYKHPSCPKESQIHWTTLSRPSCGMNIMGVWYDGPYCCPFTFLQRRLRGLASNGNAMRLDSDSLAHNIFGATQASECLDNTAGDQESYCCGESCTHSCPKQQPALTFATEEYKDTLALVFKCWMHLRGTEPANSSWKHLGLVRVACAGPAIECADYSSGLGPCVPVSSHDK